MEAAEIDRWFRGYLDAFAACGRGESGAAALLGHYGVPLVVSTDDGVLVLSTGDEVTAMVQQMDGMLAAGYDHSDVLELEFAQLNAVTTLCRGAFARRHRDGTEIGCLAATYVVTGSSAARRISVLAVHSS